MLVEAFIDSVCIRTVESLPEASVRFCPSLSLLLWASVVPTWRSLRWISITQDSGYVFTSMPEYNRGLTLCLAMGHFRSDHAALVVHRASGDRLRNRKQVCCKGSATICNSRFLSFALEMSSV